MQRKKIMAMLMISLFHCRLFRALEDEAIPDIDLPLDWKTVTPRAVSTPDLVGFDDCEDLEMRLLESISEDYRIQLLQAVEEQYYYFWDDAVMFDGDIVAEASADGAGGTNTPVKKSRRNGLFRNQ